MADPWKVSGLVPGSLRPSGATGTHGRSLEGVRVGSWQSQAIRDTWQILGGCQGLFLTVSDHQGHMADSWRVSGLVPGSLRPSGTHGRSLEGIRVGSWQSQAIRCNRNTWQIIGRYQGLFLAVLRPSGTHGRPLEGVRACSWQSPDHQTQQEHMADHWRVSGLVPDCLRPSGTHGRSLEGIRACSWQSPDPQTQQEHMADPWGYQGWFLTVPGSSDATGTHGQMLKSR